MSQPLAADPESAFAAVPPTAGGHFVLCLYAAIFRLLHHVKRLGEAGGAPLEALFERYPFLGEYFAEMRGHLPQELTWEESAAWWRDELAAWEADCEERLPLADLAAHPGVGEAGRIAFMTAGLVEEDSRFGTLFAELQEPLALRRPTLELVGQVARGDGGGPGESDAWTICRPLVEAGFLAVADREAPRAEWVLKVPPLLWDAGRGGVADGGAGPSRPARWCLLTPAERLPAVADLVQPPELLARLGRLPQLLAAGRTRTLVLRAGPGAEPEEVCGAVARALGRAVVAVEGAVLAEEEPSRLLGPLATLTRSLPVLVYDLGPGETAEPPPLRGYDGPTAVVLGLEGGLGPRTAEGAVTLVLPAPRAELRERSWRLALASRPAEDLPADRRALSARRRLHPPRGGDRRRPRRARRPRGGGASRRAGGGAGAQPPAPRHPGRPAGGRRRLERPGVRRVDPRQARRAGEPLPPPRAAPRPASAAASAPAATAACARSSPARAAPARRSAPASSPPSWASTSTASTWRR